MGEAGSQILCCGPAGWGLLAYVSAEAGEGINDLSELGEMDFGNSRQQMHCALGLFAADYCGQEEGGREVLEIWPWRCQMNLWAVAVLALSE